MRPKIPPVLGPPGPAGALDPVLDQTWLSVQNHAFLFWKLIITGSLVPGQVGWLRHQLLARATSMSLQYTLYVLKNIFM